MKSLELARSEADGAMQAAHFLKGMGLKEEKGVLVVLSDEGLRGCRSGPVTAFGETQECSEPRRRGK